MRPTLPRTRPLPSASSTALWIPGDAEVLWLMADRDAHHLGDLWPSALFYLVTEHGWLDFMTDEGGDEPAMVLPA